MFMHYFCSSLAPFLIYLSLICSDAGKLVKCKLYIIIKMKEKKNMFSRMNCVAFPKDIFLTIFEMIIFLFSFSIIQTLPYSFLHSPTNSYRFLNITCFFCMIYLYACFQCWLSCNKCPEIMTAILKIII